MTGREFAASSPCFCGAGDGRFFPAASYQQQLPRPGFFQESLMGYGPGLCHISSRGKKKPPGGNPGAGRVFMRKAIGALALHAGINVTTALLRSNPILLHCTKKSGGSVHSGSFFPEYSNIYFRLRCAQSLLFFDELPGPPALGAFADILNGSAGQPIGLLSQGQEGLRGQMSGIGPKYRRSLLFVR